MMQENMELCSSFTTSSPKFICHQTNDNPDIHQNNIALKETTYNGRLANDGHENSNNNDGIVASSAEPFLLPTHKYDNVSEVSHLSASSCETLLTCVPNEDLKQDQSIDEIDDLVHNNEMASTLDMSPMLLNECITNSDDTTSHAMSKSSQDLVLVPSINSSTISSPSSGSSPSTSSSINQTRSSASINDTTSTLCSPFRRRKKMIDIDDVVAVESSPTSSKNSTTRAKRSINGITLPISSKMENSSSAKTAITRDELLSLYILKLDEEANYFKVSPTSPEEELCDCSKCQSYYSDYYSRYLEEYERRQNGAPSNNDHPVEEPVIHTCDNETESIGKNIEAALLMDDILNNGINFCAIM